MSEVTDEMVSTAHAHLMSLLFTACQPNRGDVFSFMDDQREMMTSVITAALKVAPRWRPIETSPKDGTEIIGVFSNDYGYQDTPTMYGPWTMAWRGEWVSSWDGEQVIQSQSDFGTNYHEIAPDPTHWMPLPSPPSAPSKPVKEAAE